VSAPEVNPNTEQPLAHPAAIVSTEQVHVARLLGRLFGRRKTPVLLGALVLIGLPLILVLEVNGAGSVVAAGLVIVAGLLAFVSLNASFAGIDPEASQLASQLGSTPLAERLMERWLNRVRWRRWLAGCLGVLVGFFISAAPSGFGTAGFVYPGLASVCLASISAELHLLRRPAKSVRTAGFTVRQLRDYAKPRDQQAMAVVAVAACITLVWGLLTDPSGHRSWVAIWSTIALLGLAISYLIQRQVVARQRPAISDELRHADDLLRELAVSRGVARPALSFALATLGVALLRTSADGWEYLAWLGAIVCWWFNRGLGIERFVQRESTQNHSHASN